MSFYIHAGHPALLADLLDKLDVEGMSERGSDRLLEMLLEDCRKARSFVAASLVLAHWDETAEMYLYRRRPVPLWVALFVRPWIQPPLALFLRELNDDSLFLEAAQYIVTFFRGAYVRRACALLAWAFRASREDIRGLYDTSLNVNDDSALFAAERLRQIEEYAPVPDWVRGTDDMPEGWAVRGRWKGPDIPALNPEEHLGFLDVRSRDLPDDETLQKALQYALKWSQVDASLAGSDRVLAVAEKLARMTRRQIFDFLLPIAQAEHGMSLADSDDLALAWGPSHTLQTDDPDDMELGGWRMLFGTSWFGRRREEKRDAAYALAPADATPHPTAGSNCDVCFRKIRRATHCLRRMRLRGGWYGVFCSERCLRDSIDSVVDDEQDVPLTGDGRSVEQLLADRMMSELRRVGIQDRAFPESYRREPQVELADRSDPVV